MIAIERLQVDNDTDGLKHRIRIVLTVLSRRSVNARDVQH